MSKALIYIVEDDPSLGNMLLKILQLKGYENIVHFSDGKECIDSIDNKPALVILDFSLETFNGLDVLRIIKEKQPRAKMVIFSSLASDDELMQKCLKAGALAYFNKNEAGRNELIEWMDKKIKGGLFSFLK